MQYAEVIHQKYKKTPYKRNNYINYWCNTQFHCKDFIAYLGALTFRIIYSPFAQSLHMGFLVLRLNTFYINQITKYVCGTETS